MTEKVLFNQDTINLLHSKLKERASQRLSGSASFLIVREPSIAIEFNTLEYIVIIDYEGMKSPLAAVVVDFNTTEVVEWVLYV